MALRRLRPLMVLAVVTLVLALAAGPALAAPGGLGLAKKDFRGHGRAKGGPPWFSDVTTDYWAWQDVSTVAAKGFMSGYGGGFFGPRNHVTRLEVVILATRLMGFEEEALALSPLEVAQILSSTFADYPAIPAWTGARECLAYALKHDYLWPLMRSADDPAFRPNSPAKRLEVIVMLLEAAGLGAEAGEYLLAPIFFKDAKSVPSWAWGYVALATEFRVVRGSGGKLLANQPVRRAEVAALLNRVDDLVETPTDRESVAGTVVELNISTDPEEASTMTVITDGSNGQPGGGDEETYEVAAGVVVLLDDEQASLTALTSGLHVTLYFNQEGKVILIHGESETEPPATEVTGMVLSTTLNEDGRMERLTLWVDDEARIHAVSPEVEITLDGDDAPASDVVPGLTVRATLVDDEVVAIAIGEEAAEETEVAGMVLETALSSGELVSITLWHDDRAGTFTCPRPDGHPHPQW